VTHPASTHSQPLSAGTRSVTGPTNFRESRSPDRPELVDKLRLYSEAVSATQNNGQKYFMAEKFNPLIAIGNPDFSAVYLSAR